jgi:hypothetical protein
LKDLDENLLDEKEKSEVDLFLGNEKKHIKKPWYYCFLACFKKKQEVLFHFNSRNQEK